MFLNFYDSEETSYSFSSSRPYFSSAMPFSSGLPLWPRVSAFTRPTAKLRDHSNSTKSFMIADILKNDNVERKEEQEASPLYSRSGMGSLCAPYNRVPAVYPAYFPGIRQTFISAQSLPESVTEPENSSPYDLPKYFRALLNESRRFRRNRTVFTRIQLKQMEDRFIRDKYLSTQDRNEFAKALHLTPLQLKTWYQNRRMKWKKEMLKIDPAAVTTRAKGRPRKGEFS